METAKLLRAAEEGDPNQPIAEWFNASAHANESYSTIIAKLYPNAAEQQAFLRRQLIVREPGRAHRGIAELAVRGAIRAVVTTNFDDLIEQALRARGIDVQVISSDADFLRASPLIHCKQFRVYKPHGTLGTGILRNSPADIADLPDPISEELRRAFDDHGLIVLGFAGADRGIMNVLATRRRTLFPVYWMHLDGHLPEAAAFAAGETLVSVPVRGAGFAVDSLIQIQDSLSRISTGGSLVDISPAVQAVETNRKDIVPRFRGVMSEIIGAIKRVAPRPDELNLRLKPDADNVFVSALDATLPVMVEYGNLASAAAQHDSLEACKAIREEIHGMDRLFVQPHPSTVESFVAFLQQEMFLMLVAELVENDRWPVLDAVLRHLCFNSRLERESWRELNPYIDILDEYRNGRLQLNRLSVAADIVRSRHTDNLDLASVSPLDRMVGADFFLVFVTGYTPPVGEPAAGKWLPRATLSSDHAPRWLARMRSRGFAAQILPILEMAVVDPTDRLRLFFESFDRVCGINSRVWRRGLLHGLAHYDRQLRSELFTLD